jgi:hypothetical protein
LTRDVKGKRKTGSGVLGLVENNEVSRGMTVVALSDTCMVESSVVFDVQAYQNVCERGNMLNRIIIVGIRRSFPNNTECLLN